MKNSRMISAYIILGLAILYGIYPMDIIPDAIPVYGRIDDILIILLAIIYFAACKKKQMKESAPGDKNVIDVGSEGSENREK